MVVDLEEFEQALEFVDDDELVEVTPNYIRLRKKILNAHGRKRAARIDAWIQIMSNLIKVYAFEI